uniref:SDR family epimerase/dehydratase n=1 Tax=Geobacter metallireducens TaxID=28232 RepID=A0A831UBH9_GEOME
MRVLITGATGFLGSHIVRTLLVQGSEVSILKRRESSLARIGDLLPKVDSYDIEETRLEDIFSHGTKYDAIVHAATCYGRNGESVTEIVKSNVGFPVRLLEAAISGGVGSFLNADTSLPPLLNAYALSKQQFSDWGRFLGSQGRIRFINLKLEHFYGPGDDPGKFISQVITGCVTNAPEIRLTKGEQKRDFIFIDDVVSAFLLLLARTDAGGLGFHEYEVGFGEAVTIRSFVETVHRLAGSATNLNFGAVPYRSGEVMESRADITPLKNLGWQPRVSLRDGLRKIIEDELKRKRER